MPPSTRTNTVRYAPQVSGRTGLPATRASKRNPARAARGTSEMRPRPSLARVRTDYYRSTVGDGDSLPPSKGDVMPTVIAHHDVKDKDHWLASPKREEVFGPLGVTNIRTFIDPQNPAQVAVLMDVADMDVLMAAMQSEAMAEAMAYDGVLGETLVILVEA